MKKVSISLIFAGLFLFLMSCTKNADDVAINQDIQIFDSEGNEIEFKAVDESLLKELNDPTKYKVIEASDPSDNVSRSGTCEGCDVTVSSTPQGNNWYIIEGTANEVSGYMIARDAYGWPVFAVVIGACETERWRVKAYGGSIRVTGRIYNGSCDDL